jgi:hypothetical protein
MGKKAQRSVQSPLTAPASTLAIIPATPKWQEILTWAIATPSSRLACAPEYLAICLLLIHGPTIIDINEPNYRV